MSDRSRDKQAPNVDAGLENMSEDELIELIDAAMDRLPPQRLSAVGEAVESKRREKQEDIRNSLLERWKSEAEDAGMTFAALFPTPSRSRRRSSADGISTVPVKYRGPNGETWTGRGRIPRWLAAIEAEGRNRDEFRVG